MAGPRALSPSQLAAELQKLDSPKEWERELRKAYRPVGTKAAQLARAEMRGSGDRQLAAAARALRGTATTTGASIAVRRSSSVPFALSATWGKKGRTGWNAFSYTRPAPGRIVGPRAYSSAARRQHPTWVGQDWTVAVRGQGPRGINSALASGQDELVELFAVQASAFIARALPTSV